MTPLDKKHVDDWIEETLGLVAVRRAQENAARIAKGDVKNHYEAYIYLSAFLKAKNEQTRDTLSEPIYQLYRLLHALMEIKLLEFWVYEDEVSFPEKFFTVPVRSR